MVSPPHLGAAGPRPFGLIKRVDSLVPVRELVPVLRHAERLFLSGKSLRIVLEYVQRKAGSAAWKSRRPA